MMKAYYHTVVQDKPVEYQPVDNVGHSRVHHMDSVLEHGGRTSVHIHDHSSDVELPENKVQCVHNLDLAADYSCNWTEFVVDHGSVQEKGQEHEKAWHQENEKVEHPNSGFFDHSSHNHLNLVVAPACWGVVFVPNQNHSCFEDHPFVVDSFHSQDADTGYYEMDKVLCVDNHMPLDVKDEDPDDPIELGHQVPEAGKPAG